MDANFNIVKVYEVLNEMEPSMKLMEFIDSQTFGDTFILNSETAEKVDEMDTQERFQLMMLILNLWRNND